MSSGLSSALSTVSGKFSSIYSTISSKMSAARDAVGNAISALKSKFNFSWSLPHLKLPHVSISGSFSINPPSVPHFGISWYKDGGILTRPTIFGAAGNNLLAGGEAGAEAVVPLATLWDKLETMITSVFNTASTTGGSSGEGLTSTAGRLLTLDDFFSRKSGRQWRRGSLLRLLRLHMEPTDPDRRNRRRRGRLHGEAQSPRGRVLRLAGRIYKNAGGGSICVE